MSLYGLLLFAHSYVRWGVLLAAVVVLLRSLAGYRGARAWTQQDESGHRLLLAFADTQLALGVFLYVWLSPLSAAFFADPRHAVHDHVLRFFGIEHVTMMVLAIGVLHGGRRLSKKAAPPRARHGRVAAGTALFLGLVCSSVPWPGLRHGRPLFRTALPARAVTGVAEVCPPLYGARCATCHGPRGRADGIAGVSLRPPPRNFTDAKWQAATSDERLRDVIHDGGFGHALSASMPAQPDLTSVELGSLITCIRSFEEKTLPPSDRK